MKNSPFHIPNSKFSIPNSQLPRYPKYKDSGVEWLGQIPEHWDAWKMSHAVPLLGSGTTPRSDDKEYYDGGNTPWVNTGDLNDGELCHCEKRITTKALAAPQLPEALPIWFRRHCHVRCDNWKAQHPSFPGHRLTKPAAFSLATGLSSPSTFSTAS